MLMRQLIHGTHICKRYVILKTVKVKLIPGKHLQILEVNIANEAFETRLYVWQGFVIKNLG